MRGRAPDRAGAIRSPGAGGTTRTESPGAISTSTSSPTEESTRSGSLMAKTVATTKSTKA